MRYFALQGFELWHGQHVARLRNCPEEELLVMPPRRSTKWPRADDGRADLIGALATPRNHRVLLMLAGVPEDSTVEWTVRDAGGDNKIDLVSLIRRSSGGSVLQLVTCSPIKASPARLREQTAQGVRAALSALASVVVRERPSVTRLVVLSLWRSGVPVPTEAHPLPALQREADILDHVPEPSVWGFVPFTYASRPDDLYVAFGRWNEFEGEPWNQLRRAADDDGERTTLEVQGFDEGSANGVEVEEHGRRVRVSLRLKASAHKAALKQDRHASRVVRRIRALRAACYAGHFDVGTGRFVGETIEHGTPRLHWEWVEGQATSADAAQREVARALRAFIERDDA